MTHHLLHHPGFFTQNLLLLLSSLRPSLYIVDSAHELETETGKAKRGINLCPSGADKKNYIALDCNEGFMVNHTCFFHMNLR
jgi:hypothetical protein